MIRSGKFGACPLPLLSKICHRRWWVLRLLSPTCVYLTSHWTTLSLVSNEVISFSPCLPFLLLCSPCTFPNALWSFSRSQCFSKSYQFHETTLKIQCYLGVEGIQFVSLSFYICKEDSTIFQKALLSSSCCSSVAESCSILWPHGLQHARLLCPSLSLRLCSNSCSFLSLRIFIFWLSLNKDIWLIVNLNACTSSSIFSTQIFFYCIVS